MPTLPFQHVAEQALAVPATDVGGGRQRVGGEGGEQRPALGVNLVECS